MTFQYKFISKSKTLLLAGVAAAALAAVPFDIGTFDLTDAAAQSTNAGGANSGGANAGGGNDNAGGGNDNAGSGNADDGTGGKPDTAGGDGAGSDSGGGKPDTAGSMRGDLYGDLWIILRDSDGVPILSDDGFAQPLDADGNLIPLDEEGHPLDETLTMEVELGRLNVGRAPDTVLATRMDEVVAMLTSATDITVDAAGRLVLTVDGVAKTIDSPLENLAIYVALMTTGSIDDVGDLPGTAFDFLTDGVLTTADLEASAVFLAAATDKTGVFTSDEIVYINAFLGINLVTDGDVTYSDVDYSSLVYDRTDTYGSVFVEVLVQQTDGTWVQTSVNVLDAVFDGLTASASGSLDAYTLAADDARMVINFIHEYAIPADETN